MSDGPNRSVDPDEARKARKKAARKNYHPDPQRLLPQSPDAEKGVLSSALIAPNDTLGICAEKRTTRDYFYIPAHSLIYTRLLDLWNCNEPITFITLTQHLRDLGELEQAGGAAFVTELFTFLPTAANAAYYIEILSEKHILREIINVGTEFVSRAYDEQDNVPLLLDEFEQKVLAIRAQINSSEATHAKPLVVKAIGAIEELYARRGSVTGLATGFCDLDKMIDGMHPTDLIIIGARPSQGKTALAMNIAEFVALELKKAVLIFSLEMSKEQLMQRSLCSRSRVDLSRVRDGYLAERDFPALQTSASKFAESKMYFDDTSDLTIQELRGKARRMKQRHDIQLIVVDYLQLLRSNTKRAKDNRQLEIAEISSGLKAMAKELGIPVIVLAQINRSPEQRASWRPRMSDLRESGAIEADADTILLLVREETMVDDPEEKKRCEGEALLIVAKQRNGPVGDVALTFLKEFTRFENRAEEDDGQCEMVI